MEVNLITSPFYRNPLEASQRANYSGVTQPQRWQLNIQSLLFSFFLRINKMHGHTLYLWQMGRQLVTIRRACNNNLVLGELTIKCQRIIFWSKKKNTIAYLKKPQAIWCVGVEDHNDGESLRLPNDNNELHKDHMPKITSISSSHLDDNIILGLTSMLKICQICYNGTQQCKVKSLINIRVKTKKKLSRLGPLYII